MVKEKTGTKTGTKSPTFIQLNVQWRPRRYPVRWALDWFQVPIWDSWAWEKWVSDGPPPSDYWPPLYKDLEEKEPISTYEDFEILPLEVKSRIIQNLRDLYFDNVEKPHWENIYGEDDGYGEDGDLTSLEKYQYLESFTEVGMAQDPHLAINLFNTDFPRLVRKWGYPSENELIPLTINNRDDNQRIRSWLSREPLYFDIIKLLPSMFGNTKKFMESVIKIVDKYALLNRTKGDSLKDWYFFTLEVSYIYHLHGNLAKMMEDFGPLAEVIPYKFCKIAAYELLVSVKSWPKYGFYSLCPGYARDTEEMKEEIREMVSKMITRYLVGSFSDKPITAAEFGNKTARTLKRAIGGSLVGYSDSGAWLNCGARQWAFLELGELFSNVGFRRCVAPNGEGGICGNVITKPAKGRYLADEELAASGKKVPKTRRGPNTRESKLSQNRDYCSEACRKALQRAKEKA